MRHNKLIIFILVCAFLFNGLSLKVFAADLLEPPTGSTKLIDLEKIVPEPILNFFEKLEQIGADFVSSIKVDDAIENPETGASNWLTYLKNAWEWIKDKLEDVLGVNFINKIASVATWIVEKIIILVKSII